jgi:hypothetical protein
MAMSNKYEKKVDLTKAFLLAADEYDEEKLDKKLFDFWYNIRKKDSGGLRLTDYGYKFVTQRAEIKEYKVEFPEQFAITPQVLLWLDNYIASPYYITKKWISVFSEKSAFELYLFSGDIRKYGYNKALSHRLDQKS